MFYRRNSSSDSEKTEITPPPAAPVPASPQTAAAAPPATVAETAKTGSPDKLPETPKPSSLQMNTTPTSVPPNPATAGFKTDIPRRVVDLPAGAPAKRPGLPGEGLAGSNEMRKLIVGRDISLSGEIASCDMLVVEGTVEAKLRDGRTIEIADSGLFKGSVEIDEADIGGRFEGDITVRGTLKVRTSGRINGSIRYGQLEVEQGGQLTGTIEVLGGTGKVTPKREPEVAAAGSGD